MGLLFYLQYVKQYFLFKKWLKYDFLFQLPIFCKSKCDWTSVKSTVLLWEKIWTFHPFEWRKWPSFICVHVLILFMPVISTSHDVSLRSFQNLTDFLTCDKEDRSSGLINYMHTVVVTDISFTLMYFVRPEYQVITWNY